MKESIPHRRTGWYLLALLAALPVIVWYLGGGLPADGLMSAASVFRALGQVAGLVGIMLFALSFVLSLRQVKALEDLFGGLNHLYFAHHVAGGVAFILILLHPVLLAARFLVADDPDRAARLLLPLRLGSIFGWLGLLIMIIFLGATFFVRMKYHRWHGLHLLSGAAFVFSVVHVYIVPSDVTRDPALGALIGFMSVIGLAAFLWRLTSAREGPRRYEYRVSTVRHYGPTTTEMILEPVGPPLTFRAGQFAYLSVARPHAAGSQLESHPLSLTSDPDDRTLQVVVEALGDDTRKFQRIRAGTLVYLEGPYGRFSFRNVPRRKQIWIAGGIGITPFLSMARSLRRRERGYAIDLYYCTATKAEAHFLRELQAIDHSFATFRVVSWCSNRQGLITAQEIRKQSGPLKRADILIIGPPPMMEALKVQFLALGIREHQITTEAFNLGL